MKQWGIGESNQKELTQKGDEYKEEKQSPRAEQQVQRSTSRVECFLVGVGELADGELARRLLRWLSSGVDGQVVRQPR